MKEYFPHDHNARHDRKIAALVEKYKSAGYGIFWVANEMLHEEGGSIEYDELTIGAIAKQLNEERDLVSKVLSDCIYVFKLYIEAKGTITSSRVKQNLSKKEAKRSKKAESGRLGGIRSGLIRKRKQNEAPLQANEANEPKESKGKESKEEEKKIMEVNVPENFCLITIYNKGYTQLNGSFKNLSEKGFLKWKKFIDFIYKNSFQELFKFKCINPEDFEKLDFPESKWKETIEAILSTGIEEKHNLFFRIPQFIKYTNKNGKETDRHVGKTIEFDKL